MVPLTPCLPLTTPRRPVTWSQFSPRLSRSSTQSSRSFAAADSAAKPASAATGAEEAAAEGATAAAEDPEAADPGTEGKGGEDKETKYKFCSDINPVHFVSKPIMSSKLLFLCSNLKYIGNSCTPSIVSTSRNIL